MSDIDDDLPTPKKKKKGGFKKFIMLTLVVLIVGGAGGGGFYAWSSGMFGGASAGAAASGPRLVPKSEQKRVGAPGEAGAAGTTKTPTGVGGEKYASNYYAMDKEFTSNLQDSVHFIQVGIAVSTHYDDTVIANIKTDEIAVRSAILMTLGETTEEQVFTAAGKKQLQQRLAKAINDTLKQKEGFGGIGNVYFTTFVVQ